MPHRPVTFKTNRHSVGSVDRSVFKSTSVDENDCHRSCNQTSHDHLLIGPFFCSQIRNRQRNPSPGKWLRATGPGPEPVSAERGRRLLVHRPGRHADQRQVRSRSTGIRTGRRPSAHAAAPAARDRQAARVPRYATVHTGTGLQQEEVNASHVNRTAL